MHIVILMEKKSAKSERIEIGIRFENAVFELMENHGFFPVLEPKPSEQKKDEWHRGLLEPDLMFEYNGIQVWVDCMFRSTFERGSLLLYYEWEYLAREKAYAGLSDPLFIAVGIGGRPEKPNMFLFDHYTSFNLNYMTRDRCDRVATHFKGDFIEYKVRQTLQRKKLL
jgi:hypothetical protein